MESQEGKNSNLSDASSAKYNIQVGPALWASCAKNRFFFPVPKQLGRKRVLPGNHGFFSFRHWLLVEPLEWNEIRISVDLSSPLTRNRLFFCRILLPNGMMDGFFPLIPSIQKESPSCTSSAKWELRLVVDQQKAWEKRILCINHTRQEESLYLSIRNLGRV